MSCCPKCPPCSIPEMRHGPWLPVLSRSCCVLWQRRLMPVQLGVRRQKSGWRRVLGWDSGSATGCLCDRGQVPLPPASILPL